MSLIHCHFVYIKSIGDGWQIFQVELGKRGPCSRARARARSDVVNRIAWTGSNFNTEYSEIRSPDRRVGNKGKKKKRKRAIVVRNKQESCNRLQTALPISQVSAIMMMMMMMSRSLQWVVCNRFGLLHSYTRDGDEDGRNCRG